jgi:arginine exporter protein ArgO
LQKDFELREDVRLGLFADVFNLLNDDAYLDTLSSIGTSDNFNLPDDFIRPRRVQLGAKLRF